MSFVWVHPCTTLSRHRVIDGTRCVSTVCAADLNLVNTWMRAAGGNFLRVCMWGGSGWVRGASCPRQRGGRLLCGYNMAGQLYCLQRGCAAVFSQFQAANDARKLSLAGGWSIITLCGGQSKIAALHLIAIIRKWCWRWRTDGAALFFSRGCYI